MRMLKTQHSQTSNTLKSDKHDTQLPHLKVYYKALECSFVIEFNIACDPSALISLVNKVAQGELLAAQ